MVAILFAVGSMAMTFDLKLRMRISPTANFIKRARGSVYLLCTSSYCTYYCRRPGDLSLLYSLKEHFCTLSYGSSAADSADVVARHPIRARVSRVLSSAIFSSLTVVTRPVVCP